MSYTIEELAVRVGGVIRGAGGTVITDAQPLESAAPGHITFIAGKSHLKHLAETRASVVLVTEALAEQAACPEGVTLLIVADPQAAFVSILRLYRLQVAPPTWGISPEAQIHSTATIAQNVAIAAGVTISEHVVIGPGCELYPGVWIGAGCVLGAQVTLRPNVVLYADVKVGNRVTIHANSVIGADGFSYRVVNGAHEKIPQLGGVRIEDDVEIGACTTIDRGAINDTVIGRGSKLDNLVQVGHNCQIGQHNIMASQVGIAGSVTTGNYVVFAGQSGACDHLTIGTGAVMAARAGVISSLPGGETYFGFPAAPHKEALKILASSKKVPQMREQIRSLESEVSNLGRLVESLLTAGGRTVIDRAA